MSVITRLQCIYVGTNWWQILMTYKMPTASFTALVIFYNWYQKSPRQTQCRSHSWYSYPVCGGHMLEATTYCWTSIKRFTIVAVRCYAITAYAVMRHLSVCQSRSWILSKRIHVPSKMFHHRVATSHIILVFRTKHYGNIPMATP